MNDAKRTFAPERAGVAFLVGSFSTTVEIPPWPSMPKPSTGNDTSVIAWALDSMFPSIEEENVNSALGHYKGHGMLGFGSQTRQFVLSMFNNFGDHPTYHGDMAGDTLVLQTHALAPRHAFDQKLLWYKDGDAVRLKILNDFGNGFLPALEETATRVVPKTNEDAFESPDLKLPIFIRRGPGGTQPERISTLAPSATRRFPFRRSVIYT